MIRLYIDNLESLYFIHCLINEVFGEEGKKELNINILYVEAEHKFVYEIAVKNQKDDKNEEERNDSVFNQEPRIFKKRE